MKINHSLCLFLIMFMLWMPMGWAYLYEELDPKPDTAPSLTYAQIETIIRTKKIVSLDQFLASLPEDYRKHYNFVYESKSIQAENASPTFPRAIIKGLDSKLVITFTKKASGGQTDKIEIMEWDHENQGFKFRELEFDGKTSPLLQPAEVNPPKCLRCHGDPPSPIWEAYNVWPGVYGSLDRQGCETMGQNSKEFSMYKTFLEQARYQGHYSHLPKELPDEHRYVKGCSERTSNEYVFRNAVSTKPNSQFAYQLMQLNYAHIRKRFQKHPQYDKFKFAMAAVRNCKDIASFFPSAHQAMGKTQAQWEGHIQKRIDGEFEKKQKRYYENNTTDSGIKGRMPINFALQDYRGQKASGYAPLAYVAERMGLDPENFSLTLGNGSFNFATPVESLIYSRNPFLDLSREFTSVYEEVSPCNSYGQGASKGNEEAYQAACCEALRKKSLETLRGAAVAICPDKPTPILPPATQDNMRVLKNKLSENALENPFQIIRGTCLDCHTKRGVGPPLPFKEKAKFETWISTPANNQRIIDKLIGQNLAEEEQSMPPYQPLAREVVQGLVDYINSLAPSTEQN